jgi:hypothetical protein
VSRYIDEHRGRFGVEPICTTLDVGASSPKDRNPRLEVSVKPSLPQEGDRAGCGGPPPRA